MRGIRLPKVAGPFRLDGEAYIGFGSALILADGTEIIIIAKNVDGIASILDALRYDGDFSLENCHDLIVGNAAGAKKLSGAPLNSNLEDDDIPF